MPSPTPAIATLYTAFIAAATLSCSYALHKVYCRTRHQAKESQVVDQAPVQSLKVSESREAKYKRIRSELPKTLAEWRFFEKEGYKLLDGWTYMWDRVQEILREQDATLWDPSISDNVVWARNGFGLRRPGGLAYVHPGRVNGGMNPGSIKRLSAFEFGNPLQRPATTYESYDVMIRVIVVNGEGQEHLDVARRLGTGPQSFLCNNHVLPLLYEFEIEDIVFGVFPLVGASMTVAFDYWPKNSVGDVLDMILQMLEALEFIHEQKIAHRDAFRDNFVVQWHPESLLEGKKSVSRPRVYIIDFEAAIQFPKEYSEEQCTTTGLPIGQSFGDPSDYARPYPRECTTGEPYNAFKLDVWQLGSSLEDFKPNISSIEAVLESMRIEDSGSRPRAGEVLASLKNIVDSMTPDSLAFAPLSVHSFATTGSSCEAENSVYTYDTAFLSD